MKKVPKEALRRQILVLLSVYFNVFIMGSTYVWSSIAVYFFSNGTEVSANSSQLALMISLTEVGRLVFAIPGGILVDKFGRKKIIFITSLLHSLGFLILSLCAQVNAIYVARLLFGIATALVNATAMTCIGEIASPEVRAKLTGIYQQFMMIGGGFQMIFLAIFSSYFTIQYCTVFLSLLSFVFFYWTLETPDYLISISKFDKALKNFKYLRAKYKEDDIRSDFEKTKRYIEDEKTRKDKNNWLQFIKSGEIRTPLITVFLLNFFGIGCGFYISQYFVTSIIPNNQYIDNKYFPLVYFCTSLVVLLILPMYIEKFRRRVFFISGALLLVLLNLLQTITYIFYSKFNNDVCKWIYIFSYVMNGLVNCGSIQPMVSVSKSEILPQTVRGFGSAITVISQSLANILFIFAFNYFWNNFGLQYNFFIFAVNSLILLILVYYRLPESRGKLLADIQTMKNVEFSKLPTDNVAV